MPTKDRKGNFIPYTMYAFSDGEMKRILDSCSNMADYILFLLASRYGFRREDIVKIKTNNVDTENLSITYYEHKKNKDRMIYIEPDVVRELKRYMNTFGKREYLFPFTDGSTAWQHLQNVCKVAGIPVPVGRRGRPFHSLRGTCVKMRQAQGWTLNEVATLIGDDPETVALYYAKVSMSEIGNKMHCEVKA
jgi:integrase